MRVVPFTIRAALAFNSETHRRLPRVTGGLWDVAVEDCGTVLGVAIVGRPCRMMEGLQILEITRLAVREGVPNGCSMLYGACSRAARAMGAVGLVTYTHIDEPGTSLRAAGYVCDGQTRGGDWSRTGRPRATIDSRPKLRWWAPWSGPIARLNLIRRNISETGVDSKGCTGVQ